MKRKIINEVIEEVNKIGYEVLDKEYLNNSTKMNFKCKECGVIRVSTFNNLKRRCKCENCEEIKLAESEMERYLNMTNELNRNLCKSEILEYQFSYTRLNKYSKKLGYKSFGDFKNKHNIKYFQNDKLYLKDIIESYEWFYNTYNKFPTVKDCTKYENLYSRSVTIKILNENNMNLKDLCILISGGKEDKYTRFIGLDLADYDKYKSRYIDACKELGEPISVHKLGEYELPNSRWILDNCPNKDVKTYSDFYKWCGFKRTQDITKEEATEIIYKMQSKLNRPLMYDDFRNPTEDNIGITSVRKYWKTMNKMKVELGLEIIQEDMVCKHIKDFKLIKEEVLFICDTVYSKENRKTIMSKDINKYNRLNVRSEVFRKVFKQNSTTIRNIIESYGFEYQKEGNGMVIYNDNGEITKSSYEYIFSNKLKELGFEYNKDYFRDVRYKTFIDNYNEMMDCDYIIHINDRMVYIEVAGMLSRYEKQYKNNEIISSKAKSKYADKLNIKENMFIDNKLEYFILFPSDLKEENLDNLFDSILNIKQNIKELSA